MLNVVSADEFCGAEVENRVLETQRSVRICAAV